MSLFSKTKIFYPMDHINVVELYEPYVNVVLYFVRKIKHTHG